MFDLEVKVSKFFGWVNTTKILTSLNRTSKTQRRPSHIQRQWVIIVLCCIISICFCMWIRKAKFMVTAIEERIDERERELVAQLKRIPRERLALLSKSVPRTTDRFPAPESKYDVPKPNANQPQWPPFQTHESRTLAVRTSVRWLGKDLC